MLPSIMEADIFKKHFNCINKPFSPQGNSLPQTLSQQGTASKQEFLTTACKSLNGTLPQGQWVTTDGRRRHEVQGGGWQLDWHVCLLQSSSLLHFLPHINDLCAH